MISAGKWASSPDSRSMPTVDLQWWLSSTDVFWMCNIRNAFRKQTCRVESTHGWYLVKRSQMVSGFDEKGLVDPWMVHVMSRCSYQTQEHVQRSQLICQLQNTNMELRTGEIFTPHILTLKASVYVVPQPKLSPSKNYYYHNILLFLL